MVILLILFLAVPDCLELSSFDQALLLKQAKLKHPLVMFQSIDPRKTGLEHWLLNNLLYSLPWCSGMINILYSQRYWRGLRSEFNLFRFEICFQLQCFNNRTYKTVTVSKHVQVVLLIYHEMTTVRAVEVNF